MKHEKITKSFELTEHLSWVPVLNSINTALASPLQSPKINSCMESRQYLRISQNPAWNLVNISEYQNPARNHFNISEYQNPAWNQSNLKSQSVLLPSNR